jgi:hypothetical protein
MAEDATTIVRLLDPRGEMATFEFDAAFELSDLPPFLWKQTRDHFSGLFQQRKDGPQNEYELVCRMSAEEVSNIPCF